MVAEPMFKIEVLAQTHKALHRDVFFPNGPKFFVKFKLGRVMKKGDFGTVILMKNEMG